MDPMEITAKGDPIPLQTTFTNGNGTVFTVKRAFLTPITGWQYIVHMSHVDNENQVSWKFLRDRVNSGHFTVAPPAGRTYTV